MLFPPDLSFYIFEDAYERMHQNIILAHVILEMEPDTWESSTLFSVPYAGFFFGYSIMNILRSKLENFGFYHQLIQSEKTSLEC